MKPTALHFLILTVAGWLQRRREEYIAYLLAENTVYKEHFAKRGFRLTDAQRRRLAVKGKAVGRAGLARTATIGTPDTILRWYRQLVATKYDGSRKRGPGRPRIRVDIAALIVRMANENPRWGYTRIRGALSVLRMFVGRSTALVHGPRFGVCAPGCYGARPMKYPSRRQYKPLARIKRYGRPWRRRSPASDRRRRSVASDRDSAAC
jgi:hypothetical protein